MRHPHTAGRESEKWAVELWLGDVIVHHLKLTSTLILAVGLVVAVVGAAINDSPVWTLTGLLLIWAGIVKIIVIYLWRGLATDRRTSSRDQD